MQKFEFVVLVYILILTTCRKRSIKGLILLFFLFCDWIHKPPLPTRKNLINNSWLTLRVNILSKIHFINGLYSCYNLSSRIKLVFVKDFKIKSIIYKRQEKSINIIKMKIFGHLGQNIVLIRILQSP